MRFAASPTGFEQAFATVVLRRGDFPAARPGVFAVEALLLAGDRFLPVEAPERAPSALVFVPETELVFIPAAPFPLTFAFASAFSASAPFSGFAELALFPADRAPALSFPALGAARFPVAFGVCVDVFPAFAGFFRATLCLVAFSDIYMIAP